MVSGSDPTYGIHLQKTSSSTSARYGVYSRVDKSATGSIYALYGYAGGAGQSGTHYGVRGYAYGTAINYGVRGSASGGTTTNYGIYGFASGTGTNYAGYFNGNVHVVGTLSKGAGSFKIDHPLDPVNKYLSHSFVESPDMMNVYNGNVVLTRGGTATIEMPDWFEALNREFRYQLTAIGAPGPNLYIAEKMAGNRFKIAGGESGMEVSWQVTGIRHDRYAEANRIPVEEDKPENERGRYLHAEAYGKPRTMSVDYDEVEEAEMRRQEEEHKQYEQQRLEAAEKGENLPEHFAPDSESRMDPPPAPRQQEREERDRLDGVELSEHLPPEFAPSSGSLTDLPTAGGKEE